MPQKSLSEVNSLKLTVRAKKGPASMLKASRPVLVAPAVRESFHTWAPKSPSSVTYASFVRTTANTAPAARRALDLLPGENEDSILNGMTRSLHRRVMGLNIPQSTVIAASQPLAMPMAAVRRESIQRQPRIAS